MTGAVAIVVGVALLLFDVLVFLPWVFRVPK